MSMLSERELEEYPSRKAIVDELTDAGVYAIVYEFMGMGTEETHYRHFLVDVCSGDKDVIATIFRKYVKQKSDIHFTELYDYELGPYVIWVPCMLSEILI
jgi:hypothetical protein